MKRIKELWVKLNGFTKLAILLLFACALLNLFARITAFCDFFTDHLFFLASGSIGRISSVFPFSFGELEIVLLIIFTLGTLVLSFLHFFLRKKDKYKAFYRVWMRVFVSVIIIALYLMTLNCSIPYGCSKLSINDKKPQDYGFEDLMALRNYLVKNCNELSKRVDRDANGDAVFDSSCGQDIPRGLIDAAKAAMHNISDEYPRLSGYFPRPKALAGSVFMYETHIIGVYFPFSMESNYSSYLAQVHFPATICHEYSHLKGYMFEDEANFLAYIACMSSDNDFIRYSGCLDALEYVESDLMALAEDAAYAALIKDEALDIDEQVYSDFSTYTKESRAKAARDAQWIEDRMGLKKEKVREMGESFTEGYASYYKVELNYDEVTYRLLQYFDGKLLKD